MWHCGRTSAARGDSADEEREAGPDHYVPCGGVSPESVLRLAEPSRRCEVPEVSGIFTMEPAACRHTNKTGMLVINKKSYSVQMGAIKSYTDFTGQSGPEAQLSGGNSYPRGSRHRPPSHSDGHGGFRQDGLGQSERDVGDDHDHVQPHSKRDGQNHNGHSGRDLCVGVLAGGLS
jgi:hypothetical protein